MGSTRGPAVERWRGIEGLALLQATVPCAAPEPAAFSAESRVFVDSDVRPMEWRSGRLTGRSPARSGSGALHLLAVVAGRVGFETASTRWSGGPHSVHVLRSDEDLRWATSDDVHLLQLSLPFAQLPPHLRDRRATPAGEVPAGALRTAFATALEQGFVGAVAAPACAPHLWRGLNHLALSLLDDAGDAQRAGGERLRDDIVAHIEQHISDPGLGPQAVADAFGISLRWAHHVFDGEGVPLARYIRQRRVDAVAEALRVEPWHPRISLLAARFGFSGREQLVRCFRARYGLTVAQYHARVVEGDPLPTPAGEAVAV